MTTELVRQLLEAGVHFGHQTKRWNPKMKPFIFGSRAGIYIIDLEQTEQHLKAAGEFLESIAAQGQHVLFLGTKKPAKSILEAEAIRCEMPYVVNRWLGGTLTNYQTIKRKIERLRELRTKRQEGFFEQLSKKEAKRLQRELDRLEEHFCGLADMTRLPAAMFVIDTKREQIAVKEANRVGMPIVAICDTNADPDLIAYPIPGNDDAIRSIRVIVAQVAERILAGRRSAAELEPMVKPENGASVEPEPVAAPADEHKAKDGQVGEESQP